MIFCSSRYRLHSSAPLPPSHCRRKACLFSVVIHYSAETKMAQCLMKLSSSSSSSPLCSFNGGSYRRPSSLIPYSTCRPKPTNTITKIRCIGWDPEGILGAPQSGHIAKLEFKRLLQKDVKAKEAFERQVREEKERRKALRESRIIPESTEKLVEYLLDTEAQEIEFEIARLRSRLNEEFFAYLKLELGKLRFAVSKTPDMEDRVIELEALQKALQEGIEAYDKMQSELIRARQSLMKLLTSNDVKTTLLDMVEQNEVNRSLLALLDENIASASRGNQTQAAEYMEKMRGALIKYITV